MPGDRGLTVGLSGSVGSGKSTLARELAQRLGGVVSGFGDYVRHLAAAAGEEPSRPVLQRIGQERVRADPSAFVRDFLAWASPPGDLPLVVDGVRHASIDSELRAWSREQGRDYALVLVDASLRVRAERRHDGDETATRDIDSHPVEAETTTALPNLADVVLDGDGTPEEVLERLVASAPEPLASRLG